MRKDYTLTPKFKVIVDHYCLAFDRRFVERLMPSSRDTTWLCSRDGIDW